MFPQDPKLSIVVVVYDMVREAPRTLFSMSAQYQTGVSEQDFEVIVVDNGSPTPLDHAAVSNGGPNFRLIRVDDAKRSPISALNAAISTARAPNIAIAIDGARMLSPGVLSLCLDALERFERPVVTTLAMHLGSDPFSISIPKGYNSAKEDALLDGISWPEDGYRLFEIASFAGSSSRGWLHPIAESNFVAMSKELLDQVGSLDAGFESSGGGMGNMEFYRRICDTEDITLVCLFGEATFHQVHGLCELDKPEEYTPYDKKALMQEYREVSGMDYARSDRMAQFFGRLDRTGPMGLNAETKAAIAARLIEP